MKLTTVLAISLLGFFAHAQKGFQNFDVKKNKKLLVESLSLKTDLTMMLVGEIPLIAEVQFGYHNGIEIGMDYNYNYMVSPLRNGLTGNGEYERFSTWVPTLGYMVGYRYYTYGMLQSGSFIGFQYKYKMLRRDYNGPLDNYPDPQVTDTYHILAVAFGRNFLFGDRFLMEIFMSVGYRHARIVRYEPVAFASSELERVERTPIVPDDRVMPFFVQFGFRVGLFPYK